MVSVPVAQQTIIIISNAMSLSQQALCASFYALECASECLK